MKIARPSGTTPGSNALADGERWNAHDQGKPNDDEEQSYDEISVPSTER